MVLYQFHTRKFDFVVIPPSELLARYDELRGKSHKIQSYVWVTNQGRCWETRGLQKDEVQEVCDGTYEDVIRDLTSYLNAWPFS